MTDPAAAIQSEAANLNVSESVVAEMDKTLAQDVDSVLKGVSSEATRSPATTAVLSDADSPFTVQSASPPQLPESDGPYMGRRPDLSFVSASMLGSNQEVFADSGFTTKLENLVAELAALSPEGTKAVDTVESSLSYCTHEVSSTERHVREPGDTTFPVTQGSGTAEEVCSKIKGDDIMTEPAVLDCSALRTPEFEVEAFQTPESKSEILDELPEGVDTMKTDDRNEEVIRRVELVKARSVDQRLKYIDEEMKEAKAEAMKTKLSLRTQLVEDRDIDELEGEESMGDGESHSDGRASELVDPAGTEETAGETIEGAKLSTDDISGAPLEDLVKADTLHTETPSDQNDAMLVSAISENATRPLVETESDSDEGELTVPLTEEPFKGADAEIGGADRSKDCATELEENVRDAAAGRDSSLKSVEVAPLVSSVSEPEGQDTIYAAVKAKEGLETDRVGTLMSNERTDMTEAAEPEADMKKTLVNTDKVGGMSESARSDDAASEGTAAATVCPLPDQAKEEEAAIGQSTLDESETSMIETTVNAPESDEIVMEESPSGQETNAVESSKEEISMSETPTTDGPNPTNALSEADKIIATGIYTSSSLPEEESQEKEPQDMERKISEVANVEKEVPHPTSTQETTQETNSAEEVGPEATPAMEVVPDERTAEETSRVEPQQDDSEVAKETTGIRETIDQEISATQVPVEDEGARGTEEQSVAEEAVGERFASEISGGEAWTAEEPSTADVMMDIPATTHEDSVMTEPFVTEDMSLSEDRSEIRDDTAGDARIDGDAAIEELPSIDDTPVQEVWDGLHTPQTEVPLNEAPHATETADSEETSILVVVSAEESVVRTSQFTDAERTTEEISKMSSTENEPISLGGETRDVDADVKTPTFKATSSITIGSDREENEIKVSVTVDDVLVENHKEVRTPRMEDQDNKRMKRDIYSSTPRASTADAGSNRPVLVNLSKSIFESVPVHSNVTASALRPIYTDIGQTRAVFEKPAAPSNADATAYSSPAPSLKQRFVFERIASPSKADVTSVSPVTPRGTQRAVYESKPSPSNADTSTNSPNEAPKSARGFFVSKVVPSTADVSAWSPVRETAQGPSVFETKARPSIAHARYCDAPTTPQGPVVFERPAAASTAAVRHSDTLEGYQSHRTTFVSQPTASVADVRALDPSPADPAQSSGQFQNTPTRSTSWMKWDDGVEPPRTTGTVFETNSEAAERSKPSSQSAELEVCTTGNESSEDR